ncbi:hypothetical protein KCTC52924_01327 [Arenibacter antarcticus]|uniref:DUF4175 family protein n=1 Tax=Arenibacter antarcticus TaxID=2040469 RepID=A0ABW5VA54_9FLAO|nr:DUF4175 family protein [Arenibacter sp. H213]MCM4167858.1 hypothetical protein [Arenibacter sp. H213]
MDNYQNILNKLNTFTAKFYTKMLLKGVLLFLAIGLLFFLLILGIEYFLWLNSTGRLLLFLIIISTEIFLLIKFIIIPLLFLFRLKRGLTYKQASLLIGKHFKEVDDKLYNLLDLTESNNKSDLLIASIEQRSNNLTVIPFVKAIDLRENYKYLKFLLIPIFLLGLIWLFGDMVSFMGSYKRVVNYDLAYEPPAPFKFNILTKDLNVLDSEPFTIQVTTEGKIRPEGIFMVKEDKEFMLQHTDGIYSYVFTPPIKNIAFHFSANGIKSKSLILNVLNTPRIQGFDMVLNFPAYTKKAQETLLSTGNVTLPEGTKIEWKIRAIHTEEVILTTTDTLLKFKKDQNNFNLNQKVYSNTEYKISTSNAVVHDYENLVYSLSVIKDGYPTIRVQQQLDSLDPNVSYYKGEATDDYELSKIRLVYYPSENETSLQKMELSQPRQNFNSFYYTFPSGLNLQQGKEYSFYFEAVDNDAINGPKSTKSQVFTTKFLDDSELLDLNIQAKKAILSNMDKNLDKIKQQQKSLEQLNREQKEKERLSFNDQNKIKDYLKKQEQQENLMKRFRNELKDNLKQTEKDDKLNKMLQERIERQDIEARKNEKLLEELKQLTDKISKEDLSKRLEEFGNKQKNSQRNLEQLLELTKRYYVEEKINQLGNNLRELAIAQDTLAGKDTKTDNSPEQQQELNKKFEGISEELEEIQKDNESLKKPISLKIDKTKQASIKKDQEDALEELKDRQEEKDTENDSETKPSSKARSKQKSAAQKMKEMGEQLQKSAASSGESSMTEDAEVLRQVLDNLITFSFAQEQLYNGLKKVDLTSNLFSGTVKKQQELRELFTHVDDSLFALSLRQADISEMVNEQIIEVYYNVDKALENLAESQFYQGASYQKYVLNATNVLTDLLANILENMQQQMQSSSRKGKGSDFQLPDIILGQKQLQEKMEEMGQGPPKEGKDGRDGKAGKDGKNKPGENGAPKDGDNGQSQGEGKSNNNNNNGKDGKENSTGSGPNEAELQEIYEIYKEQQNLREQLEKQLKSLINNDDRKLGEKLAKQMEEFQNQLLENGITQETLSQMNNLNYQLMKLENANMEQGEKEERESKTASDKFQNPLLSTPEVFKKTENDVEILNRQALPLRQSYKNKVKDYFRSDD